MTPDQLDDDAAKDIETAFRRFMQDRTTRFMLSLVPGTAKGDALEVIIMAALAAGHRAGSGFVAGVMAKQMVNQLKEQNNGKI